MDLLYRILYAAHANGTHHKLALRALTLLEGPDAEGWRTALLAHAPRLLTGSKAPDKVFKDFQNHVLHPAAPGSGKADWGGAPTQAAEWAHRSREALAKRRWSDAAYALGVLSHYYTDPWMPFHTGSSEEENRVHRGAEWSVNKSFESLWSEVEPRLDALRMTAPDGEDWVEAMVREAAYASSKRYRDMINGYDFTVGAKTPELGLDAETRVFVGEMLGRAASGFARMIERLTEMAEVKPPSVMLTPRIAVAALEIPVKWVTKKLADAEDRAAVEAMYAEYASTGEVRKTLPMEVVQVRALKAASIEADRVARAPAAPPPDASAPSIAYAPRQSRRDDVLALDAPVERAPSIGPKTASRLEKLGVRTVRDLVAVDPKSLADALKDRRISTEIVTAWRDQAALLTRVPRLKAAHAVLLVATGYRDVPAIAASDEQRLAQQLEKTAADPKTKRLLRRVETPKKDDVRRIIDQARGAMAA